jgi:hypothetical protein
MIKRSLTTKLLAVALVISIQSMFLPLIASSERAAISGTILSSHDHGPLVGVKIHAGDPRTGEIFSSQPTPEDGSFVIEGLPASSYELAVEANGGLYVVDSKVQLAPGQAESVNVAVNFKKAPSPEEKKKKKAGSVWNNQLIASGFVVVSAVLIGELIKEATEESVQSPTEP